MSEMILSDSCFEDFRKIIHEFTGITIDKTRKVMLVGRIRKRTTDLSLPSYEKYLRYIKDNKEEKETFINLVTTNETYFYRTPRVWDFIENDFLPNQYKEGKREVKIWSAASSTGEEAYTLGTICQSFKEKESKWMYKIKGTDIDSGVVKRATEGIYKGRAIKRFRDQRAELFEKYMKGDDEKGFSVIPSIKSNISFSEHNLFSVLRDNEKFDLVLLRNVLIYFTREDQKKVLANITRRLNDGGFLIIGESETLSQIETDFVSVSPLVYQFDKASSNKDAA